MSIHRRYYLRADHEPARVQLWQWNGSRGRGRPASHQMLTTLRETDLRKIADALHDHADDIAKKNGRTR